MWSSHTVTTQLTSKSSGVYVKVGEYCRFQLGQASDEVKDITRTDRENTLVCVFDPKSPRITAYQIHEWI